MDRRTFLLTCLASPLGCAADAAAPLDAADEASPPDTQPVTAQVERRLRVIEVDGTLYCELTLLNLSRSRITVPRYPRSFAISRVDDVKVEDLGGGQVLVRDAHRSWLFRQRSQVELGPGEGYIKRLSFDRPPPGRYRLTLRMREGFEQLEPAPVAFEVQLDKHKARQPAQSRPS